MGARVSGVDKAEPAQLRAWEVGAETAVVQTCHEVASVVSGALHARKRGP